MARNNPWIISYRLERSQRILETLYVSLGLSIEEVQKCVGMYPRLLSYSVDGKLHTLIRTLARSAMQYIDSFDNEEDDNDANYYIESIKNTNTSVLLTNDVVISLKRRRNNIIRRFVRDLIVRYPLLLGSSMNLVTERLEAMNSIANLNIYDKKKLWYDFIKILRRSPNVHKKWMAKHGL